MKTWLVATALVVGGILTGCGQKTAEELAGGMDSEKADEEVIGSPASAEGTANDAEETPMDTTQSAKPQAEEEWKQEIGLYAVLDTSEGKIVCRLFKKKTPITVKNFVGLAKGTKEWTDPKTGKKVKRPFYDGLVFHRVIPNFMIQGGCPLGNGMGGPGYKFEDEFDKSLRFDKVGKLAMANSGPATNGSQFFITVSTPEYLNDKHTIFGEVVEGMDVTSAISKVATGAQDRPKTAVVLKSVKIVYVSGDADQDG